MISRIEAGTANPSLETIKYIAGELQLPVSYFLSENDDLLFYEKSEVIDSIYRGFHAKEYLYCINKIKALSGIDNELAFIMASSFYELGKDCLVRGALSTAQKSFEEAVKYAEKTVFDTSYMMSTIPLYASVSANIQAPLLEFDASVYENGLYKVFDYEFYKYVTQDYSFPFKNPLMKRHALAKNSIKNRNYIEAIRYLTEAEDLAKIEGYNAFIVFGIYTDLELCYKQQYNFEKAYLYSSKRMSMLEGFKS